MKKQSYRNLMVCGIVAISCMLASLAWGHYSKGSGIYNIQLHVQNKMKDGTKLNVKDVKIKVKKGASWTGWVSLGNSTQTINGSGGEYKWKHKYSAKYTYKFKVSVQCGNGAWKEHTTNSVLFDSSDNDSNYFFVYTGSCSLKKSNDT